jgi:hypothetical protein
MLRKRDEDGRRDREGRMKKERTKGIPGGRAFVRWR